jgi:signal transduction histidine kinase
MRSLADQAGCALSIDAPKPVVGAWDSARLRQVLANLVENACRYGPGQPITASVRAEGQVAVLEVLDGGPGLEAVTALFEPYARGPSPPSGLGLGLFVARKIIEAHSGSIEASSASEGGSNFIIRLPGVIEHAEAAVHA